MPTPLDRLNLDAPTCPNEMSYPTPNGKTLNIHTVLTAIVTDGADTEAKLLEHFGLPSKEEVYLSTGRMIVAGFVNAVLCKGLTYWKFEDRQTVSVPTKLGRAAVAELAAAA